VEIPKPDGGVRNLGVPTVTDRFIQQAIAQVLTPIYEEQFHDHSYGFRPNRCAQQAILTALEMMNDGNEWIVDIDLEKFFDTVNHDKLMTIIGRTIKDGDVISIVRKYLVSGIMIDDEYEDSIVGTPQGGNLSPLLANIMLNELDKEMEKRGLNFVRYADDRIITGYPRATEKEEWEKLGYEDHIMVTGEPFALWVIESAKDISKEFPLPDAGLPVIFTDNQKPYKQRKVRILNGAHTSFVLASYLCGNDIVRQSMQDDDIRNFMLKTIYDEVIPTLSLPEEELKQFAESLLARGMVIKDD
jgi:hypothetical protein